MSIFGGKYDSGMDGKRPTCEEREVQVVSCGEV